ncbi:FAD-dependent oxidoreductase [Stenotrophomonas maltophilia]|nr:FAD-dependent oxidoreductase [Stenotrophomonas maltophilia]
MNNHAVIGAGPMGLMAAVKLLDQGHSVTIYERNDDISGMSASFGMAAPRRPSST